MTQFFFTNFSNKLRTHSLFLLTLASLAAAPAQAAILELSGPAGASVTVNGRHRGFFPLEHPLDLGPGNYVIQCTLPGHKDYQSEVFLADEADWKRLQVRLTPYSKKTAVTSNILLAGLGQHYLDQPTKGWLFNLAEAGGLLTSLVAEAGRVNARKDYLLLKDKYDAAINTNDLDYFRQKTEEAFADMQDKEKLRDTGLLVAGSAIVLSMLDALVYFPSLKAGPGPTPTSAGQDDYGVRPGDAGDFLQTAHAGFTMTF